MLQQALAHWGLFAALWGLLALILTFTLAVANVILLAASASPPVRVAIRLMLLLTIGGGLLLYNVAELFTGHSYSMFLQTFFLIVTIYAAYHLLDNARVYLTKLLDLLLTLGGNLLVLFFGFFVSDIGFQGLRRRPKFGIDRDWRDEQVHAIRPRPTFSDIDSERPGRYANCVLFDSNKEQILAPGRSLKSGQELWVSIDIGPLSAEDQVSEPVAFPQELLPQRDLWLDVMLCSTSFLVGTTLGELGQSTAAHGRLMLPANGERAQTESGEHYLYFLMKSPIVHAAPARLLLRPFYDAPLPPAISARARVCYYYRNSLVQSQLIDAHVGFGTDGFSIVVDYTLSTTLADLEQISEARRLSIHTNESRDGTHQIVVRGFPDVPRGASVSISDDGIGTLIESLRGELEFIVGHQFARSKRDLKDALKKLAPIGRTLRGAVARGPEVETILTEAIVDRNDVSIEVSRTANTYFAFPWSFIYEIPLEDDAIKRDQLTFCPVVEQWDGKSPLFDLDARRCPAAHGGLHDGNTLCPFGFWGYRYSVTQLGSSATVLRRIAVADRATFVVGQADDVPNTLEAHLTRLKSMLINTFNAKELLVGRTKNEIKNLLLQDLPMAYFYCHGKYPNLDTAETFLAVGKDESISPRDFNGWRLIHRVTNREVIWSRARPLIFINACHSVQIVPKTMLSFVDEFVTNAQAAGVIGTEVRVNPELAITFAEKFFTGLITDQLPVDRALHLARMMFLASGNLFGLVYTPYCPGDLRMQREVAAGAAQN